MKRYILFAAISLLSAFTLSSCVEDDLYGPASITEMTNTIAYSQDNTVTVTATIDGLKGVQSATLHYKAGSAAYTDVAMTASGKTYSGTIPAMAMDTEVTYYVSAISNSGDLSNSAEITYKVGEAPVDYTGLRLNELNGNDKFIEIYNAGDHDIYIGNVQMFKDGDFSAATWTAPSVTLNKGAFVLLYSADVSADHSDLAGELFFNSGLSSKKAVRITLTKPDGTTAISDFNLVTHPTGKTIDGSYGVNADGKWYIQSTPTPGSANTDGTEILTGLAE